jgi:prepilin-type N-terminal cleavage/methylation domain-containing protein
MKKGFTLLEILAVILVLAILLIIAVPILNNVINNSKIRAHDKNENMVIKAARHYVINNRSVLPTSDWSTREITLNQLQTNDLIGDIKDPNSNVNCNGYVLLTKIESNNYEYTPHLKCGNQNTIGNSANDGLIGQWKLDGRGLDNSLNGNHGTIVGATPTINRFGSTDRAYNFNGSNNYINNGNKPEFNLTNTGAILLWVKPSRSFPSDSTTTMFRGIISKTPGGGAGQQSYYIDWYGTNTARTLRGGIGDSSGANTVLISNYNFNDEWHHLALVWNASDVILYANGIELGRTSQTRTAQITTKELEIGRAFNSSTNSWHGLIDDVRIYSRPLHPEEIKNIYDLERIRSR